MGSSSFSSRVDILLNPEEGFHRRKLITNHFIFKQQHKHCLSRGVRSTINHLAYLNMCCYVGYSNKTIVRARCSISLCRRKNFRCELYMLSSGYLNRSWLQYHLSSFLTWRQSASRTYRSQFVNCDSFERLLLGGEWLSLRESNNRDVNYGK